MFHRFILTIAVVSLLAAPAFAASHRNGPLILEDQTANLNDFYIFRSYETGRSDRIVGRLHCLQLLEIELLRRFGRRLGSRSLIRALTAADEARRDSETHENC